MKKLSRFLVTVILVMMCTDLYAQEVESEKKYTRTQVELTGWIPYAGCLLTSAMIGIFPQNDYTNLTFALTDTLFTIPAAIVNPEYTLKGVAFTGASYASYFGMNLLPDYAEKSLVAERFFNAGMKGNMWLKYKGYEKARSMCDYYPEYETLSFKDAMLSPFRGETLKEPYVWIPIAAYGAGATLIQCLGGFDNSIFKTGEAYLGKYKVPVAAGLGAVLALSLINYTFTGVGEEALFRGVGYEDIKVSFGPWPAKIADAVLFPAVHVPQQIAAGIDAATILTAFGVQSAVTLLLDYIYDRGGLTSSIAAHAWFDIIGAGLSYLFTSGTQNNQFSMNITFSTSF